MLLGQDLGGRHERSLVPARHRRQKAPQRDEGFARPHVSLEQPVHRDRLAQIRLDLADGPLLGSRQRKRQPLPEPRDQVRADLVRDSLALALHGTLAHHKHQLQPEQLVETQAPPGRVLGRNGPGLVDLPHGPVPAGEIMLLQGGGGDRVLDFADPLQCLRDTRLRSPWK